MLGPSAERWKNSSAPSVSHNIITDIHRMLRWKSSTRPYFSHTANRRAPSQRHLTAIGDRIRGTLTSAGGTDLFPDNGVMSFDAARRVSNTCRESQGITVHFEASDLIGTRPGIVP